MNTTNNTTTTGAPRTGVLGKIKNALDPNVNTTAGATTDVNGGYGNTAGGYGTGTTGTTTGTHHHAGRDAALAGGAVGVAQHERNVHPGGVTAGGEQRYENTAAGTGHGTGLGGKIKNALDPNVDSNGNPKNGYAAGNGNVGYAVGSGAGAGTTTGTHHHHAGRDAALAGGAVGAAEHHHNHHNANATGGGYGTGAGTTGAGYGNTAAGAGTGVGASTGTANVNPSGGHASLTHAKGKIEEGLGNLTGNPNLQQKGLARQEQANAERYQTGQLSEAQRLEQAAQAKRGNAVQSGAHPTHGALGGGL